MSISTFCDISAKVEVRQAYYKNITTIVWSTTVNLSFLTGQMAGKLIKDDEITVVGQINVLTYMLIDRSVENIVLY